MVDMVASLNGAQEGNASPDIGFGTFMIDTAADTLDFSLLPFGVKINLASTAAQGVERAPTTTIPSEPVQVTQPEDSGEADEEDGDEDEKGKKDKGKDRGKSQGNGKGDDSD